MLEKLELLPKDPILGMGQLYAEDNNPLKVNLSVGVFQDAAGHTPILKAVKQAEAQLIQHQKSKIYTPQAGDALYLSGMKTLLTATANVDAHRIQLVSTPGGCGALRMASELIRTSNSNATVWMSSPTWGNHKPLIESAGLNTANYDYYDINSGEVNFQAMLASLQNAKAGDCVLLHACCHNPTGADLTTSQWSEVIELCNQRQLIPFLDMAYQGLGLGLEADGLAVKSVLEQCEEAIIVVSCSKNFGLYRERTGAILLLGRNSKEVNAAHSHVLSNARQSYSLPPYHGSGIVGTILADEKLSEMWKQELESMRQSIISSRSMLADALNQHQSRRDYSYLTRNCGMFSYLGLSKQQVITLREDYSIFMLESSRINIVGVQAGNIDYCVNSIVTVCN